jgi:anti-repressor protein
MDLAIFNFNSNQVRTVEIESVVWFFAQDISAILGYSATGAMMKRLDDDEKRTHAIQNGTNYSNQALINESGLYNAVIGSQLDSAKQFKKWITAEVLPSIRKTGQYSMRPEILIAHAIIEANKLIENQTALIAEMKPKAEFFDAVTGSHDAVDIGTVAKVLNLGIGRTKLFSFLRDSSILQDNNQPYQKHIDAGHFRVIESSYTKPDGSTHISFKTVVYQKGIDYIRKRYIQEVGHV